MGKKSVTFSFDDGVLQDKRLIDIDADESEFLFEDGLLKLNLGTVKNDVEENQRKRDFEISVLPRSNCIKEID